MESDLSLFNYNTLFNDENRNSNTTHHQISYHIHDRWTNGKHLSQNHMLRATWKGSMHDAFRDQSSRMDKTVAMPTRVHLRLHLG
jgi:hypothetical protein